MGKWTGDDTDVILVALCLIMLGVRMGRLEKAHNKLVYALMESDYQADRYDRVTMAEVVRTDD